MFSSFYNVFCLTCVFFVFKWFFLCFLCRFLCFFCFFIFLFFFVFYVFLFFFVFSKIYFYLNKKNKKKNKKMVVPPKVHFFNLPGDADIVIKTGSDIWISARKSKSRVLFSLLLQKNMHYINVVEDVRRLTHTLFSKTYFSEF